MADQTFSPEIETFVAELRRTMGQERFAKGSASGPAIALAIVASDDGEFAVVGSDFRLSRSTVYMICGLLDQVKLDMLSTVPDNRPLREPYAEDEDDDDDIGSLPPIGSA